jgi:hypothetical protein
MPTQPFAAFAAVLSLCLGLLASSTQGAAMAFDDASGTVYAADWVHGQNGGFGFGPWILNPNPEQTGIAGAFTASSQPNGDGTGNIDTGGRSWGLYANFSGITSEAVRLFTAGGVTGDNTLGIGEQFLIRFDNGFCDIGGAVGFGLRNSSGENRFEFYFAGGQSNYTLNIANDVLTMHGVIYAGMTLKFTLTGPDTFNLDVNYATGIPAMETISGTLQGTPGSGIDRFRLFNFAAGTGGKNVYFNSVQVVPEPSSLVFLGAGAFLAVRRRSRG